jgi:Xaa-Pro aminopeptidase
MVREAQQAAFDAVRPGIACQEIDRVARRLIADVGYSDQFMVEESPVNSSRECASRSSQAPICRTGSESESKTSSR